MAHECIPLFIPDTAGSLPPNKIPTFLSYGGGVQSTCLVIMALEGLIERPDWIVFADTGSEMPYTTEIVEIIKEKCASADPPLPFVTVEQGEAFHVAYTNNNALPVIGIRSCTSKWKIEPIKRFMRTKVGNGRGKVIAETWLGISTDERRRANPSSDKWSSRRYPLLELNMSRDDCKFFLKSRGLNVKKSGCFMCPYQSGRQWASLNLKHPELFAMALDMETRAKKVRGFRGGLWGSRRSIEAFNATMTLEDFGFDISCDPAGGCFL